MGSTMISCLCSFCAPHQLEVNPILTGLLSATGSQPKLPIAANVSHAKGIPCFTTKSNLLHTHEVGTDRDESLKQREPLNFGIEKILYSSSGKEFNDQHLGVPDPQPYSTSKRCLSLPWSRPVFTSHQRMTLENCFQHEHYLTKRDRYCLSLHLGLTEHQIKIWFQNRRVKYRHEQKEHKHRA
ncbi:PREDICTED: homeobox protein CDX-1-like [Acropora digitifera]|uniref:homeobox protein CDX-1-like n=1 Tax=Acropora digitifera TaxID=70779 RepID=UPI00077AF8B8|nr:PREDICTED: homeobox protein CDX-1-like [Acropora digitifera]